MEKNVRISIIDRKNPDWIFYSDAWQMLSILYEGGVKLQRNVDKFVVRRPKELYDVFYERTRRLTYQDILQSCISWHLSKMFQRDPTILLKDNASPDLKNFLENCDNCNTSFIKYSREILEKMMLYRSAYVLVDKPRPDGSMPLITKQDVIESGVNKPYLVTFDPRYVINWKKDQYGQFDWVVIKTITQNQESATSNVSVVMNWWVFDRQNYYQYQLEVDKKKQDLDINTLLLEDGNKVFGTTSNTNASLVDFGEHALAKSNMVPLIQCQLPMDLWHANRAYLHLLEHVDAMNGYSWKLFMCNLPQLVIKSEEEMTGQTLSETGFIQMGTQDSIEWLEPKTASFQESRAHLQNTRQEIYRAFHLQAQAKDSTATADGASGYSKEVEMMPAVDILNALGSELRSASQNILIAVKLSVGLPASDQDRPDVSGYDHETKPTLQDIEKFQAANDSGVLAKSKTLEQTLSIDIAYDMLGGKNAELKQKVRDEIMVAKTNLELEEEQADKQASRQQDAGGEVGQKQQFTQRDARDSALKTIKAVETA